MPKRPPRVVRELSVPADLRGAGPTCALVLPATPAPGTGAAAGAACRGELWHADVLELLGKLADGSVDLVIADPPYAIAKAEWDEFESLDAYLDWCDRWLAEVARVLAPHGSAYVCGFSEILADVKARSARRFASCRWLVWYYRNKANLGRDWGRSHESILHLRHAGARIDVDAIRVPYNGHTTRYPGRIQAVSSQYGGASARRDRWEPNPLGAKPRDVLEVPVICNGMSEKTPHATQKPEALIEKLILASSTPGQLVVDPFVGSGTTAVVAARLGRSWLAGDGDPRFVGLVRERLAAGQAGTEHRAEPGGSTARREAPPATAPDRRAGRKLRAEVATPRDAAPRERTRRRKATMAPREVTAGEPAAPSKLAAHVGTEATPREVTAGEPAAPSTLAAHGATELGAPAGKRRIRRKLSARASLPGPQGVLRFAVADVASPPGPDVALGAPLDGAARGKRHGQPTT